MNQPSPPAQLDDFLRRWAASGAAERANYVLFLTQLCHLLEVPEPDPTGPDDEQNAYVFERAVKFSEAGGGESVGRIDLYKRGCFVLEAKQGSDQETAAEHEVAQLAAVAKPKRRGTAVRGTPAWDDAMLRARGQADRYARALPVGEGWPPFLVVVDVVHSIELYSECSRSGKTYIPYSRPAIVSHFGGWHGGQQVSHKLWPKTHALASAATEGVILAPAAPSADLDARGGLLYFFSPQDSFSAGWMALMYLTHESR